MKKTKKMKKMKQKQQTKRNNVRRIKHRSVILKKNK